MSAVHCLSSLLLCALASGNCVGVRPDLTEQAQFPVDARYRIGSEVHTVEVDSVGVVRLFLQGGEVLYGKCSRATLAELTGLLGSPELTKDLAQIERARIQYGPGRTRLITLWGRGEPFGGNIEREYHSSVVVALDDPIGTSPRVDRLVELLDTAGREAFGGRYRAMTEGATIRSE